MTVANLSTILRQLFFTLKALKTSKICFLLLYADCNENIYNYILIKTIVIMIF